MLASEFCKSGHEVRIVTSTPAIEKDDFPFKIIRRPRPLVLLRSLAWCDVYFHNNISLQTVWPLLFLRRPWVVVHHTWIARPDGSLGFRDRLKRMAIKFATNISVSSAIAAKLPVKSAVIQNSYRDDLFIRYANDQRSKELAFVGRLVSDKGVDLLVEAMGLLKKQGLEPRLTVIGSGVELEALKTLARDKRVSAQIDFVGVKTGKALVELLNEHLVLVVPSRWQEPFGLVALEGIACGCVVVGSSGGGLKDAIGSCGVTFQNGNVAELASILRRFLLRPEELDVYRVGAKKHLEAHQRSVVAQAYLQVFEKVLAR
ncbi:MAG: glycosyltransferase family 1 protein [Verrucomicrobiales bacterium]|nr:glycosyltransferase family 1 protein [Verrucomicrobiales bacterium]